MSAHSHPHASVSDDLHDALFSHTTMIFVRLVGNVFPEKGNISESLNMVP